MKGIAKLNEEYDPEHRILMRERQHDTTDELLASMPCFKLPLVPLEWDG